MTRRGDVARDPPATSSRLAIAAVVVSAVVGVLAMVGSIVSAKLSTDASHRDQQERLSHDRLTTDVAELRSVVDEAAVNLEAELITASDLEFYWRSGYQPGLSATANTSRRQHIRSLASAARLDVRVGVATPMANHYVHAINAAASIEGETQRPVTAASDRRVTALAHTLESERAAFLVEARHVVGSRLSAPG